MSDKTLGQRVGDALIQSLDYSYKKGRGDAREEIEKAIDALPVRVRQGVELIPKADALRILHDMDTYSDGAT